jgi:prepilin-type N-terminal cleavage/methylation domain-containing protein
MIEHQRRDESGFTMVEMLVVLVVMGVLFAAVTAVFLVTGRQVTANKTTLGRANDSQFVVTYMSRDLTSATSKTTSPSAQPVTGQILSGTNVLQASWKQVFGDAATGTSRHLVSYRYVKNGTSWELVRREYESNSAAGAYSLVATQVLAHDLAAPATGWVDGVAAPTHALNLTLKNPDSRSRQAVDLTLTPFTGSPLIAGGQNLSTGAAVPARPPEERWYPSTVALGRCSGRVALVVDTSGSVPIAGGGYHLEQAAAGFIDGLADMSMSMTVIGFDREAYQLYPGTGRQFGQYFSLNDAAARTAARDRILALDDVDYAFDYRDAPTADGVHWQQTAVPWVDPLDGQTYYYNGGTNWEDALWSTERDSAGNLLTADKMPTLVVFITDGIPNQVRPAVDDGTDEAIAVSAAASVVNDLKFRGIEVVGIGVGDTFDNSPAALDNMTTAVGPTVWDKRTPGNARDADVFVGRFSELGQILNTITSSRCVSGATFRPTNSTGGPAGNYWIISDGPNQQTSDATIDPLVQFNFPMIGTPTRWVDIKILQPDTSPGIANLNCSVNGVPLGSDRVQLLGGSWSQESVARIRVAVNEAMSCLIVEKP